MSTASSAAQTGEVDTATFPTTYDATAQGHAVHTDIEGANDVLVVRTQH